jgi:ArsR family transcriptional regulator
MDTIARLLKILGDRNRLRIVNLLMRRPVCVCELVFVLGIKQPSVSKHLKKLKAAGLIDHLQDGFWTNYRLRVLKGIEGRVLECVRAWSLQDRQAARDIRTLAKADRRRLCCR